VCEGLAVCGPLGGQRQPVIGWCVVWVGLPTGLFWLCWAAEAVVCPARRLAAVGPMSRVALPVGSLPQALASCGAGACCSCCRGGVVGEGGAAAGAVRVCRPVRVVSVVEPSPMCRGEKHRGASLAGGQAPSVGCVLLQG
jgi:hypothetical protein